MQELAGFPYGQQYGYFTCFGEGERYGPFPGGKAVR